MAEKQTQCEDSTEKETQGKKGESEDNGKKIPEELKKLQENMAQPGHQDEKEGSEATTVVLPEGPRTQEEQFHYDIMNNEIEGAEQKDESRAEKSPGEQADMEDILEIELEVEP